MVPSSICADAPLPWFRGVTAVVLRRVGARQPGKGGGDGGGCEDSRVRADYTIWRV